MGNCIFWEPILLRAKCNLNHFECESSVVVGIDNKLELVWYFRLIPTMGNDNKLELVSDWYPPTHHGYQSPANSCPQGTKSSDRPSTISLESFEIHSTNLVTRKYMLRFCVLRKIFVFIKKVEIEPLAQFQLWSCWQIILNETEEKRHQSSLLFSPQFW